MSKCVPVYFSQTIWVHLKIPPPEVEWTTCDLWPGHTFPLFHIISQVLNTYWSTTSRFLALFHVFPYSTLLFLPSDIVRHNPNHTLLLLLVLSGTRTVAQECTTKWGQCFKCSSSLAPIQSTWGREQEPREEEEEEGSWNGMLLTGHMWSTLSGSPWTT